ncbi:glutathione S-transferase [Marinobacterium sp. AK62]|uniref:Glutathione S-transferase n=1 Tax=Marinobacterium alkalitolerans TaxID=1542925 RepID=A0ABS3ZA71_9GAMM|nr:glutathione S-transferase [Marinobacterium alkalitolerans]MBP0047939.1 glutathione S-transferase [Marinobacterium alkalitolerans]
MYTLYFIPGACSLATQAILNELDQASTLIHKLEADHFETLNPAGTVPVLKDGDKVLNEGVAIILHLLNKHENSLIPESGEARHRAIENMMFANATMHPAYGRLFFAQANVTDPAVKQQIFDTAAVAINKLWRVVEAKLQHTPYLGGNDISPADILLTVYSRWSDFFPVEIVLGPNTRRMVDAVLKRESMQRAIQREQDYSAGAVA